MKKFTLSLIATILFSLFINATIFAQDNFNVNPTNGCAPLTVTFTVTGSSANAYQYNWQFWDGTPNLVDTTPTTVVHTYTASGNYSPRVDIYDNTGGYVATVYGNNIMVNGLSSFSSPDSVCLNDQIMVCPNGQITSCLWNFGDGNTSTNGCPTHAYTSLGTYTISLIAGTSCGTYTVTKSIVVANSVSANPNTYYNTSPTCPNTPISFNTDQYSSYLWNFGDGSSTSTIQNPTHSYTIAGTYSLTLTVTNGCGKTGSHIGIVTISNTAGFPGGMGIGLGPNMACIGQTVNAYIYNDNGYPKYVWNFGDSSPKDSSGSNVNHSFSALGTYTVSCKISNQCGQDSTFYNVVTISNYVPFPNNPGFQLTNTSPACPSSNVSFNAPNGYNNFEWNFGDGSSLSTTTQNWNNHNYSNSIATYTATVRITSACGNDTTIKTIVQITNSAPWNTQNFQTYVTSPACPNSSVYLQGPCGYSNYQWNFGDGSPVSSTTSCSTNHTYGSVLTTYTVSLTITNGCGNDTTIYLNAQITNNAPWGNNNFQIQAMSPACPNSNVSFQGPCGYNLYQWNFGDGSPVMTATSCNNVNHYYGSTLTTYTVSLTITNGCGNDTTIYTNVQIQNNVGFPNQSWFQLQGGPNPACPNDNLNIQAPSGYSSYQWNFGDGSPVVTTSGNNNPNYESHSYTATGTYTVSVLITNACGNDTTLYGIVQIQNGVGFPSNQNSFDLQVSSSPSCPNSSVNLSAPGGYLSYVFNFGDGSPKDSTSEASVNHTYGSTLGTFTVSVKITNGCGYDTTLYSAVQISSNAPWATQNFQFNTSPNPSCPNDEVDFNGPNGYANYLWTFGDGNTATSTENYANHTYTAIATYTVSVKVTNSCGNDTTLYSTTTVSNSGSFSSYLSIQETPQGSSCPNDLVGFQLQGGQFNLYTWSFGDGDTSITTGRDIQHSYTATGTYTVSCKVTNGCGNTTTVYSTISITNNAPVSTSLKIDGTVPNPSCPGDEAFFLVKNGQSSYQYVWNFGDGSPQDTTIGSGASHTYASVGIYTVTVNVTNGCGSTATLTVTQTVSNNVVPTLTSTGDNKPMWGFPGGDNGNTTAGCAGDAIIFYFFGSAANNVWHFGDGDSGTATEHMLINGGDAVVPITVIKHAYSANGSYQISLTITNGCGNSVTDTMTIIIGGNLLVNGDMTTSPPPFTTCASIDFIGFGGATYSWNFGDGNSLSTTSPTVSHTYATQGIYAVNVVITNGCGNSATYSKSINVNGVSGPAIILSSSVNPTCDEGSNGSAIVSVSSGQAPYVYSWNDANAQTTSSVTGLSAGLYNVTVTDNIGCSSVLAVNITNPASIVLSSSITKSSCGGADGTASVSITSGGTAPFSYQWITGGTTSTATGLSVGQYAVTVTDANGCTSTANISVSEQNGATLSSNTITNTTCNGSSDGAIDLNVTGGTSPYTYAWSNNSTTQDISNLTAGNYSITVTDNSGCKATYNGTVSQPTAILVTATVASAPTCGNFDGSALATVTGGTGAYTYIWFDTGTDSQTTQMATDLPAGSYTVFVTDANGCSNYGIVSLSNSNAPNISSVVTDVSCYGGNNGSIDLTVTGGTSPYSYGWSNSFNTQDISNLSSSIYFVSVKDKKGCTSYGLYTISQPPVLTSSVTNTGATCGNNDGTATAAASGGNGGYSYNWNSSPVQTTQTAVNLALGNYTVTVTDSKGCSAVATTTVSSSTAGQEICMVTVDTTSTKNVIVWEKPVATNIDSFRIYRLISSTYTQVGSVPYSSLSMFTDNTNGVNPNITAYKYKVSLLDTCGKESALSSFHQTMHLQVSVAAPPNSFNLSWNDYIGFSISQYRILVDSLNNGNWKVRDSVPFGNPTNWTDIYHYPDTVNYMVEIVHPSGCTATLKNPQVMSTNLNSSRSNIYRIQDTTLVSVNNVAEELSVSVFPNPSNGIFTVAVAGGSSSQYKIEIYNVLGEKVYKAQYSILNTQYSIDLRKQSKGVYYLQISTADKVSTKKIIIE